MIKYIKLFDRIEIDLIKCDLIATKFVYLQTQFVSKQILFILELTEILVGSE